MNILFLTPINPLLTNSGGAVRTKLLLDALRKCGTVYVTCLSKSEGDVGDNAHDTIRFVRPFSFEPLRFFDRCLNVLMGLCGIQSWCKYPSKERLLDILGWSGKRFDVVVTRFASTSMEVGAWRIAPVLIDIDNLPFEDYVTFGKENFGRIKQWVVGAYVRRWQDLAFKRAAGAWIPNANYLPLVSMRTKCLYLPNVVPRVPLDYDRELLVKRRLVTVASLSFRPNVEGIRWFLESVWPDVRKRFPNLEYWIVGGGASEDLIKDWSRIPGVTLTGFAEDIRPIYGESLAVVAPVFIGGGTAVKVVEALSYGRHVLATDFAIRGFTIQEKTESHITEFADAATLISAIQSLIAKGDGVISQERKEMQELIARKYSQEFFNQQVERLVLGKSGSSK